MIVTIDQSLLAMQVEGTPLTSRERQILRLLARGYTMPQAADHLGRSHETIRTQVKTARARLNAKTTTQAIAIAVSLDLI